jgi:hypothetical protein
MTNDHVVLVGFEVPLRYVLALTVLLAREIVVLMKIPRRRSTPTPIPNFVS